MNTDLFRDRLSIYAAETREDEEHALKEMLQEIILFALAESRFFEQAIFHGGTALRIHHQLPRFSEDLDFMLIVPDPHFSWEQYESNVMAICRQFGIEPEIHDRHEKGKAVQSVFIKDNSIGKLLALSFHHDPREKLTIKLEIDTNPPAGSGSENKFLEFPVACAIRVQDLPSSFALKNHAILCRAYTKGRDWYDFYWYIKRKTPLNLELLKTALHQQGPWAGQMNDEFDKGDYLNFLRNKINNLNWQDVAKDVAPFLPALERKSLAVWDKAFFLALTDKLEAYF